MNKTESFTSEVKANTKLIESEIHQFNFQVEVKAKKKEEMKKKNVQLIIIFFQHSCFAMMSSYLVQPVSKYFAFKHSFGQWNKEKAVCSTNRFSFQRNDVLCTVHVELLMLCDQIINQNDFLFISNWNEARRVEKKSS